MEQASETIKKVLHELGRSVLGQDELLRELMVAVIAGGHVLIEGVPGLAKTRVVNLLARVCELQFKRLQFTPDLLPADVVGTRIFNQHSATFETVHGPIFAHFILADEINRAPAKVQSALLETMQEKQVTIGLETIPVPRPFFVFATQNPIEQEGTYPLPEAQLDRFLLKVVVTYPEQSQEDAIVQLVIDETELPRPETLLSAERVLELQAAARKVFLEKRLIRYITDLVVTTRDPEARGLALGPYVEYGASPRASIALAQSARASALIDDRDAVTPDDIKGIAHAVLRHRVITTYYADAEGVTPDAMIDEILGAVDVP